MRDWLLPLVFVVFWVWVSVTLPGCKALCATSWESSTTTGTGAYYGPEGYVTLTLGGEIGEARCAQ